MTATKALNWAKKNRNYSWVNEKTKVKDLTPAKKGILMRAYEKSLAKKQTVKFYTDKYRKKSTSQLEDLSKSSKIPNEKKALEVLLKVRKIAKEKAGEDLFAKEGKADKPKKKKVDVVPASRMSTPKGKKITIVRNPDGVFSGINEKKYSATLMSVVGQGGRDFYPVLEVSGLYVPAAVYDQGITIFDDPFSNTLASGNYWEKSKGAFFEGKEALAENKARKDKIVNIKGLGKAGVLQYEERGLTSKQVSQLKKLKEIK